MLINAARHNTIKFRGSTTEEKAQDPPKKSTIKSAITNGVVLGGGGALVGMGLNSKSFSNVLNPEIAKLAGYNAFAQHEQNKEAYLEVADSLKNAVTMKDGAKNKFVDQFEESIKAFKATTKDTTKKAAKEETALLTERLKSIQKALNHDFSAANKDKAVNTSLNGVKGEFDGLKGEFHYQAKGWLADGNTKQRLQKTLGELDTAGKAVPNDLLDGIVNGVKNGDISQIINEKTLQNKTLRTEFINKDPVLRTYKRLMKMEKAFAKGADLEKKIFPLSAERAKDVEKLFKSHEAKLFGSINEDVNKEIEALLSEVKIEGSHLSDNILNNYKNLDADKLFRMVDESGIADKLSSSEENVVKQAEKAYLPKILKEVSMMQKVESALINEGLLVDGHIPLDVDDKNRFNQLLTGKGKKDSIAERLANISAEVYENLPGTINTKDKLADKAAAKEAAGKYFSELAGERGQLVGELKAIKKSEDLVKIVSKHVTEFLEKEQGINLNRLGTDAAKKVNPLSVARIGASFDTASSNAVKALGDLKPKQLRKELSVSMNAYEDSIRNSTGYSDLIKVAENKNKTMPTKKAALIGAGVGLVAAAALVIKNHFGHSDKSNADQT